MTPVRKVTCEERQRWHSGLVHIAAQRGYKSGWVAYKFKEKFGTWPNGLHSDPLPPADDIRNWVRSRLIAYAKARGAA